MAFAILRITKQKGGSVGASGHHNGRTRDTPNADPEREALNRLLAGEDRDLREIVSEIIEERGGKPRHDSVEAVEYLLTASPEYFMESDPQELQVKVDCFCERAMAFLRDPRVGGILAKVTFHGDERTPHIHAHVVPYDSNGKLNAKHYFGTRAKLRELQNVYHEYMAPLGLERGVVGSRATHQEVKKFYAAITKDPEFKIDRTLLPDPPKVMFTKEARDAYKESLVQAITQQLEDDFKTIAHQAMLTRDERNKRIEMERRAEVAEKHLELLKADVHELWSQNNRLAAETIAKSRQLNSEQEQTRRLKIENKKLEARVSDIPMTEVMSKLGHCGIESQSGTRYLDTQGNLALYVTNENRTHDGEHNEICRSSIALLKFVNKEYQQQPVTNEQAFGWLVEQFGVERAAGAYLADRQQAMYGYLRQQRQDIAPDRSTPARGRAVTRTHDQDRGRTDRSSYSR